MRPRHWNTLSCPPRWLRAHIRGLTLKLVLALLALTCLLVPPALADPPPPAPESVPADTGRTPLPRPTRAPDARVPAAPDAPDASASPSTMGLWAMYGTSYWYTVDLGEAPAGWRIVGAADFNGDSYSDILWRNSSTGQNGLWLMWGSTLIGYAGLPPAPTPWEIETVADFNRDGWPDIVWRNYASGAVGIWFTRHGSYASATLLPTVIDLDWVIEGAGDFNRDDWPDLLWRNYATGANGVWYLVGTSVAAMHAIEAVPATEGWFIAGVADFNADGWPDILWNNRSTGANAIWVMLGESRVALAWLPTTPANFCNLMLPPTCWGWLPLATDDFTLDSQPDILWQYTTYTYY